MLAPVGHARYFIEPYNIPRIYLFIHLSILLWCGVRCISCVARICFTFVVKFMQEEVHGAIETNTHCQVTVVRQWQCDIHTTNYKLPFTTKYNDCSIIHRLVQLEAEQSTKVCPLNKQERKIRKKKRALESRTHGAERSDRHGLHAI